MLAGSPRRKAKREADRQGESSMKDRGKGEKKRGKEAKKWTVPIIEGYRVILACFASTQAILGSWVWGSRFLVHARWK